MQENWSFPDAGKLYSKKLIVDRCLLALARHKASMMLEKTDIDALKEMRRMLQDASNISYQDNIASLSADTSRNANIFVHLLLAAKLVNSLPAVESYLVDLMQTIDKINDNKEVSQKQREKVIKFAQAFSIKIGSEITTKSTNRDSLLTVV